MQYVQRKLHRSVTEIRRSWSGRPRRSFGREAAPRVSGLWIGMDGGIASMVARNASAPAPRARAVRVRCTPGGHKSGVAKDRPVGYERVANVHSRRMHASRAFDLDG